MYVGSMFLPHSGDSYTSKTARSRILMFLISDVETGNVIYSQTLECVTECM